MINYTIEHHCSDKTRVQALLNSLCGYQNDISLKIQHRGRINLFVSLLNELKKKNNIKTTHALDIGCSSGYYSQLLFEFGFNNVVGIDLSSKGIETATNLYGTDSDKGTVGFLVENAETFQSNTKFDCILCTEVIEHTSNPEKVIENIYNLLTPIFVPYDILIKDIFVNIIEEYVVKGGRSPTGTTYSSRAQIL